MPSVIAPRVEVKTKTASHCVQNQNLYSWLRWVNICDLYIIVYRFEKIFYDFCMFVMNSYTWVYKYFPVFVAVAAPFESSCLRGAQQKTNLTVVGPPLFHEFFSFCIHAVGMWFDLYGADKIVFLMNHLPRITIIWEKYDVNIAVLRTYFLPSALQNPRIRHVWMKYEVSS